MAVVNVDEPANQHFVQDFQLYTRSLVVVDAKDPKRFKVLDKVWQLVGDKPAFQKYVEQEVRGLPEARDGRGRSPVSAHRVLARAADVGQSLSAGREHRRDVVRRPRGRAAAGARWSPGLLYTLGRVLAYVALAAILVGGLLSIPQVALFLQAHMNRVLGPLLVVVGLRLLEWIPLPGFGERPLRPPGRAPREGRARSVPCRSAARPAPSPSVRSRPACSSAASSPWRSSIARPSGCRASTGSGRACPVVVFAVLVSAGVAWAGLGVPPAAVRRALGPARDRRSS